MGKSKKCNAIVHSVYAGDGIRLYYEKPDVITYNGRSMSLSHAFGRALVQLASNKLTDKKAEIMAGLLGRDIQWDFPPHSLLCSCRKCSPSFTKYKKAIRG